jgi:hypothetical protein
MKCKVRIIKDISGLFPEYCPKKGKVYDAEYKAPYNSYQHFNPLCIINVAGKRIVIRHDEFELIGGTEGG